jgi:signal transduction histidine kinase
VNRYLQSVRGRTVTFGTLLFAVFLVVVGFTFDSAARRSRERELERAALTQLADACALVKEEVPHPLPTPRDSLLLVQMVDMAGAVVSSSANVMDMDNTFAGPLPPQGLTTSASRARTTIEGGQYLLVGQRVSAAADSPAIYVDRLSRSLRRQFLWWSPVFLVAASLGLAAVVSRSLRPVEQMRRNVASISASDLSQRVHEPSTRDELARLAQTMNQMLERLRVSSERQQRFVSDASHELRTPLTVMRTRLDVALRNQSSTDWPMVARALLDQNNRMERLVSNLLTLAKGESVLRVSDPVDLDELVSARVSDMRAIHPEIVFDLSKMSAGRVPGDPDELARLVQNLLDNAAGHARSRVQISLHAEPGWVELAIEDDGPGVPVDERERVFARFARLDSARSSAVGGAGLGLAIVADIATRHSGTVRFEDPVILGGARALVRLPSRQDA